GLDLVYGGDGRDQPRGGIGNDTLYGGAGNDSAWGEAGDDDVFGGDGNDRLQGDGNVKSKATLGNDTVFGVPVTILCWAVLATTVLMEARTTTTFSDRTARIFCSDARAMIKFWAMPILTRYLAARAMTRCSEMTR
ncbi:hypothetical protein N9X05_19090, partial [Paracoccaceae bacterium]|nr:hypothetical protein [Paracoccaceae bacterium]